MQVACRANILLHDGFWHFVFSTPIFPVPQGLIRHGRWSKAIPSHFRYGPEGAFM